MKVKPFILFIPLILSFIIVAIIICDLKSPRKITFHTCSLVGRGLVLAEFKTHARTLFSHSGHPEDDIGLNCGAWGFVVVNEAVPLPLKEEQTIQIKEINYHYMPTHYDMSVSVVNPQDAALMVPPKQATFKLPKLNIKK